MIPRDARVFRLLPGVKAPATPSGHLNAVPSRGAIPSGNYGIALDGQFLVVDFDCDHPEREDIERGLPPTWSQRTARQDAVGRHYLFRVPDDYVGSGLVVLRGSDGKKIADVKAKGYIVGPGSSVQGYPYTVEQSVDPVPAPEWLLTLCKGVPSRVSTTEEGLEGVPSGEHDRFLLETACWLRGKRGLSEEAIERFLRKGPLEVLQDTDEARPYTEHDLQRIARSAARYEAENDIEVRLSPASWRNALDIDTRLPLRDWLLYGFVPRGELTLIYGDGGIGKSTLASWLAATALTKGLTVGFAGVEEPFERFAVRTRMSKPDLPFESMASLVDIGNLWRFPKDAESLREALTQYPLDVLYFDSIYSHFDAVEGHEGIRARTCLSPLAALALEMGITVIGVFHENKAGGLMGSREMRNVSRSLLHATRPSGRPFRLSLDKTNDIDRGYALQFNGELQEAISLEGDPWKEKNEEGEIVPVKLFVMTDYLKVNQEQDEDVYKVDSVEDDRLEKIMDLKETEPHLTMEEIGKRIGVSRRTVFYIMSRAEEEKI